MAARLRAPGLARGGLFVVIGVLVAAAPPVERLHEGPLRLCYAGIVSLAKGFP